MRGSVELLSCYVVVVVVSFGSVSLYLSVWHHIMVSQFCTLRCYCSFVATHSLACCNSHQVPIASPEKTASPTQIVISALLVDY
jgi:hypothetical protein